MTLAFSSFQKRNTFCYLDFIKYVPVHLISNYNHSIAIFFFSCLNSLSHVTKTLLWISVVAAMQSVYDNELYALYLEAFFIIDLSG